MKQIVTLVTGSQHKLQGWQRQFPSHIRLQAAAVDLTEIQSMDSKLIVADKARRAYELLQRPVFVEDVSAGLDNLGGLPGPFIKFFEERLGKDALYQLAGAESPATISCTVGYFDGSAMLYSHGEIKGIVVASQGSNGFGFDTVFRPHGQSKTFAQMDPAEKDAISHRHQAIQDMLRQLEQL